MVLLLLTIVFLILRVLPGDPARLHFGEHAVQPATIEAMRQALGVNKPLINQYFDYLWGFLHGDLGKSMADYSPVSQQVFSAFPATLELAIYATAIAVIIGILLGVQASKKYNSFRDHAVRAYGILSYAIPVFYLGMVFQLVFGIGLHWFPTGERTLPGMEPTGLTIGTFHLQTGLYTVDALLEGNLTKFGYALRYLTLPSLTLGIVLSGVFLRLTRSNMLETFRMDFVAAARARGLKESTITYAYALRNAFLPILTMMGLQFAALLAGAVLTETTFSWPGLGRYLVDRIEFRDYTAVQGAVAFFGVLVALVSLVVDILYAYLDPRVRL
jgi:peptide/nickel transport system permease protein